MNFPYNPRLGETESYAGFCRRIGLETGDFLIGDEGYGPSVIMLTAIGERAILARCVSNVGKPEDGYESLWALDCRDWREVAGPQIYYGA
jgi:hypothetical protein